MDMLDRIAALLRALFGDTASAGRPADSGAARPGAGNAGRPTDPDLAAAWDELNDYLGEDASGGGARTDPSGADARRDGGAQSRGGFRTASAP
jgi:hypothetical protein